MYLTNNSHCTLNLYFDNKNENKIYSEFEWILNAADDDDDCILEWPKKEEGIICACCELT